VYYISVKLDSSEPFKNWRVLATWKQWIHTDSNPSLGASHARTRLLARVTLGFSGLSLLYSYVVDEMHACSL
jgi:hypothetical protein